MLSFLLLESFGGASLLTCTVFSCDARTRRYPGGLCACCPLSLYLGWLAKGRQPGVFLAVPACAICLSYALGWRQKTTNCCCGSPVLPCFFFGGRRSSGYRGRAFASQRSSAVVLWGVGEARSGCRSCCLERLFVAGTSPFHHCPRIDSNRQIEFVSFPPQ